MRIKTLLLFLLVAVANGFAANQLPRDPNVRIGTLDNGLSYYIRQNNTPEHRADFFIAQKVGSINEEENQQGLAHFLEHMCFNGTSHFPGNSLITYLESVGVKFGANLNAYTSTDETVYNICQVPTDRTSVIDSCLIILRDWSGDLLLKDADIDAERGVIVGEWRQRNGSANNRLLQKAAPIVYGNSIYGKRLPIGQMSIVENFKPSTLRNFYKKWYCPQNQCIIVVGDVDVDYIESQIKQLWAKASKKGVATQPVPVDDNSSIIATVQKDSELAIPSVMLYIKHDELASDKENTIDELRYDVVKELVTNMLVERFDIAEEDSVAPFTNLGIGDSKFMLSRSCKALTLRGQAKNGRIRDVVEAYAKELKRAALQGFLAGELQRAKIACRSRIDSEYANSNKTSNTDYARKYVRHYLDGGALPSAEQYYKMMKGVVNGITLEDVNSYLNNVVTTDNRNVVIIVYAPEKMSTPSDEELAASYAAINGADVEPYVDAVVAGKLLKEEPQAGSIVKEERHPIFNSSVWTLSNGIKVNVLKTDYRPDQVMILGSGPGGFSIGYDEALTPEYHLANDVLAVSGFGGYSSSELRRLLTGSTVKSAVSIENMEEQISASSSVKDMTDAFRMIYLKATSAQRDDNAYATLLANKRMKLSSNNAGATVIMGDSIHSNVYSHHPLGRKLSEYDINHVSYDRVLDLYKDRFGDMSDFTFYVVGNFDTDSLRACVSKYIASLPTNGRMEKAQDVGYRYTAGVVNKHFTCQMETPQTISYTFYNAPCDYTLHNVVAAAMVGDILKSRLMTDLRETRGWTYGVKAHGGISAGMNGSDRASLIMPIYIRVAPENAEQTFEIVTATVEQLAQAGNITDEEVSRVRSQMLKSHADNLADNSYWATVIRMYDKFGQDMSTDYAKTIESISPADLAQFITTYLLPANRIHLEMAPE
jgi:zinc protease